VEPTSTSEGEPTNAVEPTSTSEGEPTNAVEPTSTPPGGGSRPGPCRGGPWSCSQSGAGYGPIGLHDGRLLRPGHLCAVPRRALGRG
jgi:hypothetical protein